MEKITIEKLVFGGQGLGRKDGQVYFVWGALPGEEVEVDIIKAKKNFVEAIARKIIVASKDRVENREEHYLDCSPWQIISESGELQWKKEIAKETFLKFASYELGNLEIVESKSSYNYRNKVEYRFVGEVGNVQLAFFERGTDQLKAIAPCILNKEEINQAAIKVLDVINKNNVDPEKLVSLIVRSNTQAQVLATLLVSNRIKLNNINELDSLTGFAIYLANDDNIENFVLLERIGADSLEEKIGEVTLRYGAFSFFQVNPAVFSAVVDDIGMNLGADSEILDFYSGVGAISLPLANKFKRGILIENNREAVNFAATNIEKNNIKNCETRLLSASAGRELIKKDKVVIFDPPRTGLDKSIIDKLIEIKPCKIIYLSCDVVTQARDIKNLLSFYTIKSTKLYNFFPRTPHIESLCVLDRNVNI